RCRFTTHAPPHHPPAMIPSPPGMTVPTASAPPAAQVPSAAGRATASTAESRSGTGRPAEPAAGATSADAPAPADTVAASVSRHGEAAEETGGSRTAAGGRTRHADAVVV